MTKERKRPEPGTPAWSEYWAGVIADAQKETTTDIVGQSYSRIAYGADSHDGAERCSDCAVDRGQLHVPTCCVERCPKCKGQAISCECGDEAAVLH
jgi:hypothetical protein